MDQSIKGALAAASAGVVLVGSLGSLAYWNATGDVDATDVDTGTLGLTSQGAAQWALNGNDVTADIATVVLVPSDVLTLEGSFEVDAEGNNLEAGVTLGGIESETFLNSTVTAKIGGVTVTAINETDDGDIIDVVATITFPFGAGVDNTSQTQQVTLSDVTLTLLQTDATP